jgi:8-oxo-dGTP pyrophosphatase MutT (NUDIX family)
MRAHEFDQPGAAGCILYAEDTGRWGLQQRSDTVNDPGVWAAWGGGREPGESLEQCVRRELAEESGYRGPIKLEPLARNAKYATFIGIVPQEFEPRPCDEWKDFCWVELGHWPTPMHPGVAAALDNVYIKENFADGGNPVKFTVTSPDGYKHSFQITLAVHGKHVGHFNFVRSADTDDVNNEAEVESRWQGQGYGKLLLMKAIDVANNHGLDFQQDIRGITDAQQNVYDSLENAGLIVTPGDGFWFLTPQGEQELNGLNENLNQVQSMLNFEEGDCPIFAIALHRLSKLPLMALIEYDEQAGSTVLIHSYVKLDNRWRLDASGETDVNWMLQKYPNNGNAEEVEISEKDLLELGYGKNKCPTLKEVLPYAKQILQDIELNENFADGKVKGKSRPGRVKRSGASCAGSVTDLRAKAHKYGGERGKMYHWCANMKSGRKKK